MNMLNSMEMIEFSINGEKISTETLVDWYSFCVELCPILLKKYKPIGGLVLTVEIEDAKFCK